MLKKAIVPMMLLASMSHTGQWQDLHGHLLLRWHPASQNYLLDPGADTMARLFSLEAVPSSIHL